MIFIAPWWLIPAIVCWLCSIYTAAVNIKCTAYNNIITNSCEHCLFWVSNFCFWASYFRSFLCASRSCIHVWIKVIKKGKYNRCDKENGNQSHQSNASTISLFFKYMYWIIKVWLFFSVVQYLNECCKASVSHNLFISSTFCHLYRTTNKGNKMKLTLTQTIFPWAYREPGKLKFRINSKKKRQTSRQIL